MPLLWSVPGRGATRYDSNGNYYGYFTSGKTPPCLCSSCSNYNKSCPTGAVGCTQTTPPTCQTGYKPICKAYAPWCSCVADSAPDTTSSIIVLNVQIVQMLCRQNLTFAALLLALQTHFADASWDEAQLTARLAAAIKEGRVQGVGGTPGEAPEGYRLNPNMSVVNPSVNKIYECQCSGIEPTSIQVPGITYY